MYATAFVSCLGQFTLPLLLHLPLLLSSSSPFSLPRLGAVCCGIATCHPLPPRFGGKGEEGLPRVGLGGGGTSVSPEGIEGTGAKHPVCKPEVVHAPALILETGTSRFINAVEQIRGEGERRRGGGDTGELGGCGVQASKVALGTRDIGPGTSSLGHGAVLSSCPEPRQHLCCHRPQATLASTQ